MDKCDCFMCVTSCDSWRQAIAACLPANVCVVQVSGWCATLTAGMTAMTVRWRSGRCQSRLCVQPATFTSFTWCLCC